MRRRLGLLAAGMLSIGVGAAIAVSNEIGLTAKTIPSHAPMGRSSVSAPIPITPTRYPAFIPVSSRPSPEATQTVPTPTEPPPTATPGPAPVDAATPGPLIPSAGPTAAPPTPSPAPMAPATASTSTTSTLALLTPGLVVKNPRLVSKLTGRGSAGKTDERWNVVGTDLGISFEMDGRINMVFGDTWGRDGVEGAQWRTSTLGIVERHPEAGYIVTDMLKGADGNAKELISALKKPKEEYTAVPTSAIAFGGRMYIHYMLVKDWEEQWWGYKIPVVNGSGFAFSDDMGNTWTKHETARWIGNSPYAMVSMVEHEGNIYVFGTGASRFGPLKLFRVPGEQLLEYDRYEYWNGAAWTREPAEAAEVVGWPVGELSVRWSEYHEKWLMMYLNEVTHNIVLRTADSLTGPWGDERPVVHSDDYHSLYGPLMLPHIEGSDVYFAMSTFYGDYNVFIMKLTLEPATTTVP